MARIKKTKTKSCYKMKKLQSKLKRDIYNIFSGITCKDFLLSLIFPMTIILIFLLLPNHILTHLALKLKNPDMWQFFTSAFIHLDFKHLIDNLILYSVSWFLLLILANKTKNKKNLFRLLLLIIVILPPITSIIQTSDIYEAIFCYRIGPEAKAYGSSGIIYAIVGFMPIFIMFYYKNKPNKSTVDWVSFLLIILGIVVLIFSVFVNFFLVKRTAIYIHLLSLILGLGISFFYLKRQNAINSENV